MVRTRFKVTRISYTEIDGVEAREISLTPTPLAKDDVNSVFGGGAPTGALNVLFGPKTAWQDFPLGSEVYVDLTPIV